MILDKYDYKSVCEYLEKLTAHLNDKTEFRLLTIILDDEIKSVLAYSNMPSAERSHLLQHLLTQDYKENGIPDRYKKIMDRLLSDLIK